MTYVSINSPNTSINRLRKVGTIRVSGAELVRKLGWPDRGDGSTTMSEWTIESEHGTATIYDWGEANMLNESVSTWNIGGRNTDAYLVLDDAGIEENYKEVQA